MRSHVARLLTKTPRSRKMLSVALDVEQLQMVEKLALFFSEKTGRVFSKTQIVEEAVKAFVDESAGFILDEYAFDIRDTPLTDLQQYKQIRTIDVGSLDTVVLPVRDETQARHRIFKECSWNPVQLDREKLQHIRCAAFCFGGPTSAITHYARIKSFALLPGDLRKQILHFYPPEPLGQRLEWREGGARLRRPRYTAFALLQSVKCIEELFGQ